jgi:hypothetical protein
LCPSIFISASVILVLLTAFHAYQIYPITKGIINETYIMVLRVKRLDEAFSIVNELCRSYDDG